MIKKRKKSFPMSSFDVTIYKMNVHYNLFLLIYRIGRIFFSCSLNCKKVFMQNLWLIITSKLFLLGSTISSFSQDSILMKKIENDAGYIYDHTNKQYWLLTKEKPLAFAGNYGTEITVYTFNDTINRIVCIGYNESGKWAKEFILLNRELIFVYVTQNFLIENKKAPAYKNFQGYPTIEMRYYYNNKKLVGEKYEGINDKEMIRETGDLLQEECKRLIQWIKNKLPVESLI